jgi:PKHD-type hydroxylase
MHIIDVLNESELKTVKKLFSNLKYNLGKTKTGINEKVKYCNSANLNHLSYKQLYDYFFPLLETKSEFSTTYLFKNVTMPYPVQYSAGMFYNYHVDEIEMNGLRSDYSMTLFLSNPDEYEGGELVLKQGDVSTPIKLPAGKAILYETGIVHKVNTVTKGNRNVLLFWAQSIFKDKILREHCVQLAKTIQSFEDKNDFLNDLEQSRINLIRHYADI